MFGSQHLMHIFVPGEDFYWWEKPYAAYGCIHLLCNCHMIMLPILKEEDFHSPQPNPHFLSITYYRSTYQIWNILPAVPVSWLHDHSCQGFPFDWTNASACVMRPHPLQPIRSVSTQVLQEMWKENWNLDKYDWHAYLSQGSLICRDLKTSVNQHSTEQYHCSSRLEAHHGNSVACK